MENEEKHIFELVEVTDSPVWYLMLRIVVAVVVCLNVFFYFMDRYPDSFWLSYVGSTIFGYGVVTVFMPIKKKMIYK